MPQNVTIRNLTTTVFFLTSIEHQQPPEQAQKPSRSCFRAPDLGNSSSAPAGSHQDGRKDANPSDAVDAAPRKEENEIDAVVRLEPFTTRNAKVSHTVAGSHGQLRVFLQDVDGRGYIVDTPLEPKRSCPLLYLDTQLPSDHTCIYHHESSHLTLIDTPNPRAWMEAFPDSTPLTALCIPGTHNTTTSHVALPTVRCQAVSPATQLENGIRFFDLRLQANTSPLTNLTLTLVHDAFPISLTGPKHFSSVLATIKTFLRANPSETLILSLKREGTGRATDADLALALHRHYTDNSVAVDGGDSHENSTPSSEAVGQWYTEPRIPTLGEVRGKIVLLRRFALPKEMQKAGFGLDAREWEYKSANCLHGDVHVQDSCEVLRPALVAEKVKYVCEHFDRAAQVRIGAIDAGRRKVQRRRGKADSSKGEELMLSQQPATGPLYLNFLSCAYFWRLGCWPERLARRINPAVLQYLCEQFGIERDVAAMQETIVDGDGGVGVVVCDWVGENGDWDLVKFIIGMNSRLRWRMQHEEKK